MQQHSHKLIEKICIGMVLIGMILSIGHELELYLPDLETWVQHLGVFAPAGFIALFVVLTPVFVSVDALCFAAGLLFPIYTAEICIILATYMAAALIFYIGRYAFRTKVIKIIAGHPRFAALDSVISGDNAFKLMLLLRLTPLPFAMLGYALSVTKVKFQPYLAATTGILIYNGSLVYLGYTTKHLSGLMAGATSAGHIPYPVLIIGLVLALSVLFYITKVAENALKQLDMPGQDS